MRKVKWTPKAKLDLLQIAKHITKSYDSKLALEKVSEITNHVQSMLSQNPLAGRLFEANPLFSRIVFAGNSIYYCENPKDKLIYVVYVQPRKTKLTEGRLNHKDFE